MTTPIDFAALTGAVGAGPPEIRACLVMSQDGLVLGAYPPEEEARTLTLWSRIATLGDVDHGFVAGPDEIWAFCRRGAYSAMAVAAPTARPGLVLDRLQRMLALADDELLEAPRYGATPPAVRGAPDTSTQARGGAAATRETEGKREEVSDSGWERPPRPVDDRPGAKPEPAPASVRLPEDGEVSDKSREEKGEAKRAPDEAQPAVAGGSLDAGALAREFAALIRDANKDE